MSFVERHAIWTDAQQREADEVLKRIAADKLERVRLSFADQHGILRGKTLVASEAETAMRDGLGLASTLLLKDSAHRTVFPVFAAGDDPLIAGMKGAADVLLVADPASFRALPWAPGTGWLLCDVYFADGTEVPYSTRGLARRVMNGLAAQGFDYVAGLEVEFHVFRLVDPRLAPGNAGQPGAAPEVSLLNTGYQYLTEQRYDELDPVLELIRRDVMALGLPLRSLEVEFGPSQCEMTFRTGVGLEAADWMVLFRSAVKQICRRNGYHATFMCRPQIENVVSSGWHLHQSLRDRKTGKNAFMSNMRELLSPLGKRFLGGLVENAAAASIFAAPTINGYKRYQPYSLAPDRASWGHDNRGVMVRVVGSPGDPATHLENRAGEPAANPYLYMAAQIVAGMDGVKRRLDPGAPADAPYEQAAPALPQSLADAVAALKASALFGAAFGADFVAYYARLKDAEIARFNRTVTDWEQREYFAVF
jgi:glutamine synthetase